MPLPQTLDASAPAGTASPAQGDDQLRGIKDYLRDVYGAPDGSAVDPGSNSPVFTVSTTARATFNWSPLTVPTVLRGTASQILRIESQYSQIIFGINGASSMGLGTSGMIIHGALAVGGASVSSSVLAITGNTRALHFVSAMPEISTGTTALLFVANAGGTEWGRLTNSGVLLFGTTVATNAATGDVVIANARSLRGVNPAGNGTQSIVSLDSSGRAQISQWAVPSQIGLGEIFYGSSTNVIAALARGSANQILGIDGSATNLEYKTLSGTANQVTVTHGAGTITLAAPQNLATGSSPTFNALTITNGISAASLNLDGNITALGTAQSLGTITTGTWNATAVGAQYGGTGQNTSSSTGVPKISSGTWSVQGLTNGQLLVGATGAVPTAATLTAGDGISISNAAASITITNSVADAQYVTLATHGTLANERVLTAGDYITLTDAGAGGTVRVSGLPIGIYGLRRYVGANNSTTPNTSWDMSAHLVALRDASNVLTVRPATSVLICDITTGAAFNGRDQSGEFGAGNWLHFYFIANASNLASVASLTGPPNGPTLPSGYTYQAWAGPVFFNGSSQLVRTRGYGNQFSYLTHQTALASGQATTQSVVTLINYVPSHAISFIAEAQGDASDANGGLELRVASGLSFYLTPTSNARPPYFYGEIPNIDQTLYYLRSGSGLNTDIFINGYKISNGS